MIHAVLFDLDGTLADTAPDLGFALNHQRKMHGLPALPLPTIRPYVSQGGRGLMKIGFNLAPEDENYVAMREEFLNFYEERLCHDTRLFPGISELLATLQKRSLPWGVVTNKIERFTLPLMQKLKLDRRAACIISGDTCANFKPHPEPLLQASREIGVPAANCVYIGDDERDVAAAHAAGMRAMVAQYGYLGNGAHPETWGADTLINHPQDVLHYL
ncbi:MAG TPA: HAD-IA family hydrolase [Burkholderiales bacterium]|nr:HAD-IA family hydrolase [Burkholderiales bacterium]